MYSKSFVPSMSGYKFLMCLRRSSLASHITLTRQFGSTLKLRRRLGPQYPQPTTPTAIASFIYATGRFLQELTITVCLVRLTSRQQHCIYLRVDGQVKIFV